MIMKIEDTAADTLGFRVTGTVTEKDYQSTVIPEVDKAVAQHDKVNLVVVLDDLEGFEPKAAWSDITVWTRHAGNFQRLAVVGSQDWQEVMTRISGPFTSAETRFFEKSEYAQALEWTQTGREVAAGRTSA